MDTSSKMQHATVNADAPGANVESAPKPDWHVPVITRIDIKRTMEKGGAYIDGSEVTNR